jgi:hypothetical protein
MEVQSSKSESPMNGETITRAYDVAMKGYDWALQRLEVWDGNLDKILAIGAPIALALLGKVASLGRFCSDWPILLVSLLSLLWSLWLVWVGKRLTANKETGIKFIDPSDLYANWLTLSKKDFEYFGIRNASRDFDHNLKLVSMKRQLADRAAAFLVISAILSSLAWVLVAQTQLL